MNQREVEFLQAENRRLMRELDRALDNWQTAVDERNRLAKSSGSHSRPKRKHRVDGKSVEHAAKDSGKFAVAGIGVLLTAIGEKFVDRVSSGEVDVVGAALAAVEASGDWGMSIAVLLFAYFIILLAFKWLSEYP